MTSTQAAQVVQLKIASAPSRRSASVVGAARARYSAQVIITFLGDSVLAGLRRRADFVAAAAPQARPNVEQHLFLRQVGELGGAEHRVVVGRSRSAAGLDPERRRASAELAGPSSMCDIGVQAISAMKAAEQAVPHHSSMLPVPSAATSMPDSNAGQRRAQELAAACRGIARRKASVTKPATIVASSSASIGSKPRPLAAASSRGGLEGAAHQEEQHAEEHRDAGDLAAPVPSPGSRTRPA
jgi:hypothetical protein